MKCRHGLVTVIMGMYAKGAHIKDVVPEAFHWTCCNAPVHQHPLCQAASYDQPCVEQQQKLHIRPCVLHSKSGQTVLQQISSRQGKLAGHCGSGSALLVPCHNFETLRRSRASSGGGWSLPCEG